MIDPRALQQHFNKVRQRERPQKQIIPRVPEPEPLTAVRAIPVVEPIILEQTHPQIIEPIVDTTELQKELLEVTQALTTLKQSLTQTPQIDPVTITVPISVTTAITEIKDEQKVSSQRDTTEDENPYGYSIPDIRKDSDTYNPYGYYSGPKF